MHVISMDMYYSGVSKLLSIASLCMLIGGTFFKEKSAYEVVKTLTTGH